ncbi:hypothetical protein V8C86DRAFT_2435976, partial [Haematococcus lacustris]
MPAFHLSQFLESLNQDQHSGIAASGDEAELSDDASGEPSLTAAAEGPGPGDAQLSANATSSVSLHGDSAQQAPPLTREQPVARGPGPRPPSFASPGRSTQSRGQRLLLTYARQLMDGREFPKGPLLAQIHAEQRHLGVREYYGIQHLRAACQFLWEREPGSFPRKVLCSKTHPRGCSLPDCISCHFCRQKTIERKAHCRHCGAAWCGPCLAVLMPWPLQVALYLMLPFMQHEQVIQPQGLNTGVLQQGALGGGGDAAGDDDSGEDDVSSFLAAQQAAVEEWQAVQRSAASGPSELSEAREEAQASLTRVWRQWCRLSPEEPVAVTELDF